MYFLDLFIMQMKQKLVVLIYHSIYFIFIYIYRGQLTDTQKATNKFEMLTPVTYVLPISMFNDQAVLIALELHKYDDNENLNEARFYSVDLNGDSIYTIYLFISSRILYSS